MHASDLLAAVLGRHLLPAVLSSAVVFAAVVLLFWAGRLRRPACRVLFLYAALLKALLSVWAGEGISCLQARPPLAGYTAVRLPTIVAPDGVLWEPHLLARVVATSDLSLRVLLVAVVLLAAFFLYRWFRLAPLFWGLRVGEIARPEQFAAVHETFQELVARTWRAGGVAIKRPPGSIPAIARRLYYKVASRWPPRPRLRVVHGGSCFAFTMGVRPPVVVISAELIAQVAEPELRGILAHELAHVRRMDYLGRWVAAVLRDLMAWNPAVLLWYKHLVAEQEKASDERAARLLGDPAAVASGLVELAAYAGKVPLASVGPLAAWPAGAKAKLLEARLAHLEWVSRHEEAGGVGRLLVVAALLIGFLLAQPHIVVPLNRLAIPFRDLP